MATEGKKVVDTIVVSDIHLGSELSLARALRRALGAYEFKRLVLNGDIFDHLNFEPRHSTRPSNRRHSERRRRLSHEHLELLQYLRGLEQTREVVWIEGNHDDGLSQLFKTVAGSQVLQEYYWQVGSVRYMALHGDQFDSFSHEHPVLYAIGTEFYSFLQWLGPWTKPFGWWLKRKTKWYTNAITGATEGALIYAKARGVDVIVCGHTHNVLQHRKDGVHYVNGGSWTEDPCHLVAIHESGLEVHAFNSEGELIGALSTEAVFMNGSALVV